MDYCLQFPFALSGQRDGSVSQEKASFSAFLLLFFLSVFQTVYHISIKLHNPKICMND